MKRNRNGIHIIPNRSDLGDMMADRQRHDERFGIQANQRVEEMDRMEERCIGRLSHKGRS